jgi:CheY-like chemotaxis protein
MTVLVIGGADEARVQIVRALSEQGVDVLAAGTLAEARELVDHSEPPHLLLADLADVATADGIQELLRVTLRR